MSIEIRKELEEFLAKRKLLKELGWTKSDLQKQLNTRAMKSGLTKLESMEQISCQAVLEYCRPVMDRLSAEPKEGWLQFLFRDCKHVLFPENFEAVSAPEYEPGKLFYLNCLRFWIHREMDVQGFSPILHFRLASEEEQADCQMKDEYARFLEFLDNTWFLEFMRIGAEITPFNTLGHIAGVHHVAMVMARQLKKAGSPIDLALMSASAIGHDIGKFGCKDSEARRVPYLHYYYTDLCLKRFHMPGISYIAANHSTWDLELENLSLESLLLIYADFRVKSTRENGAEKIHFYSLAESFEVILNKLDNVDAAKRQRYVRVYNKLVDFEKYMTRLGVHTELELAEAPLDPPAEKDPVLMNSREIVDLYKNSAVRHNVRLMSLLNNEAAFATILETARSEKDWKNTRTYLNILKEYGTYMNQKQKQMSMEFLYELLTHYEGDIRDTAARLMGELIAGFNIEYRKELPEGKSLAIQDITGTELFRQYLSKMIVPDHKLTEKHRKWISYKVEILCISVLNHCKAKHINEFSRVITSFYEDLSFYDKLDKKDFTVFCMVLNLCELDMNMFTEDEQKLFLDFALHFASSDDQELHTAILEYISGLLELGFEAGGQTRECAGLVLDQIPVSGILSIDWLRDKISRALGRPSDFAAEKWHLSSIFLSNLKAGTPWIFKTINISFLMDQVRSKKNKQPVHTVTHLTNLMTGAECIDVRAMAGTAILEMADAISGDIYSEIAIELIQLMEAGETEASMNIPAALGQMILRMSSEEVDEMSSMLEHLLITGSDPAACMTLDTVGTILHHFPEYEIHHHVTARQQRQRFLGMLLRGMANDHDAVSREAFYVLGEYLFAADDLTLDQKRDYFAFLARKCFHILRENRESNLTFLINAAALNHIYRFISEYILLNSTLEIPVADRAAFFPGTFDPFSLSHKGIVESIRELGYEVYLAIDEFSWSKKTQPHLIRRKIAGMSTAADPGVFLFPDQVPVNIASSEDMKELRELFDGRSLYMVAGSDVPANASAYRKNVEENSIHQFNHILFSRGNDDNKKNTDEEKCRERILGHVEILHLPRPLEDISSTRIRENIDLNRDISNLIDPMVQRYIYENNLYLREPEYKPVLKTHPISAEVVEEPSEVLWEELAATILKKKHPEKLIPMLRKPGTAVTVLRDQEHGGRIRAAAISHVITPSRLQEEFESPRVTRDIRERVRGDLLILKAVYVPEDSKYYDFFQLVITELLAYYLARETGYCIYHGRTELQERNSLVRKTLERQGFVPVDIGNPEESVMIVSMHRPYVITRNMEMVLKEPFNSNPAVLAVTDACHQRLQSAIAAFDPGHLTLSVDSSVMHYRLMRMITAHNSVPYVETKPRELGEKMCVPFGKMLRGATVPNTVTKALHTEKIYQPDISYFDVEEYPNYSPLKTQIRTIRSFHRDVILVDDLLHSGERLRKLQEIIDADSGVHVSEILTGIMTANGRDQVSKYHYTADSVYFIPDLRAWFVESTLYPFIGGDSIRTAGRDSRGLLTSINLILPYVAPGFLMKYDIEQVYKMSMICLENARDILRVLEQEYRIRFERNLTLDRLGEVILSPTCPDEGNNMNFDFTQPASSYVENDISRMIRLKNITRREENH